MSLGRGLGALITSTTKDRQKREYATGSKETQNTSQKIWLIPLTEISPLKNQPRRHFDPEALNELANSIKEHGIIQPLLLHEKRDGGYEVIAGERRWRAAKLAGLSIVPALVKQITDQNKLELSLIENIQRADLNPIEEAFAYRRLMDEFGLTQEKVADKVGKSRPAIGNAVRLLELPDAVQKALIEKKINTGQARALLSLRNEKEQLEALSSMLGAKISVRDLEKETRKIKQGGFTRRDPNISFIEERIRVALGTKVNITQKGDKGTINIAYFSKEELTRLVRKITGD